MRRSPATRPATRRATGPAARHLALVLIAGTIGAWPLAALAQGAAPPVQRVPEAVNNELPIRNITLYRSGVGYFERHAVVEGHQDVQLRFNVEQINDILKSMVVLDLDGGRVASVGYGSKAPLERRLASFAVNVADNPDLATLLTRLRGAPVRLETLDGPITGTVLGVEKRSVPAGERQVVQVSFVNLITDTGIRSIDLTGVVSFEILDRELAQELNKALSAMAEQRADRIKSVDLSFSGVGERHVVVAYIHEMPMWKTSYRLVLPEAPTGEAPRREADILTLQGWAIVENTSDEDWRNVQLSLVAGRPVSFQMDLYEPLFVERPEIPVPTVPGVLPRLYQAAVQEWQQHARGARQAAPTARARELGRGQMELAEGMPARPSADLTVDDLMRYAPRAAAEGGEVGEVFHYRLQAPVSIDRQRSAMLPIITSDVEGRRVSIFNRADGAEHPMRGVQLTNTTGMQLMPGPISVFDGASYAGDAQIGHVVAGDTRLLAYAVDLEVHGIVRDETRSTMHNIRIVDGMVEETLRRRIQTAYTFNNKDQQRPRLLLVEQARRAGWDLDEPAQPAERTANLYRFEVELAPSQISEFDIVESRTERQRHAVTDYELPTLIAYARDGKASDEVVQAVRRAADMQAEVNQVRRQITALDQERTQIHQEQQRIRQNMNSVGRDTELYREYVRRLTSQETRLDEIRVQREDLQATQERLERELREFLRNLNVE